MQRHGPTFSSRYFVVRPPMIVFFLSNKICMYLPCDQPRELKWECSRGGRAGPHEAAGVVVPDGLRVAERLHDRAGLQKQLFGPQLAIFHLSLGHLRQELQRELCLLGLPGAGFATATAQQL